MEMDLTFKTVSSLYPALCLPVLTAIRIADLSEKQKTQL
jgi:hypothetical protein